MRFFVTAGTQADCQLTEPLRAGFEADYLLSDRGYDTNPIVESTLKAVASGRFVIKAQQFRTITVTATSLVLREDVLARRFMWRISRV